MGALCHLYRALPLRLPYTDPGSASLHPDYSCPDDHRFNPRFPSSGYAPHVHALHQPWEWTPELQEQACHPGRSAYTHSCNLRFGIHYLVSHWGPSWVWPHVIWLLPLFWVGGHYFQPARWIHRHLLIRFLLVSLLPGEQPFLLLQTGRQQPTSCALHQSCQKRPRLRLEIKPMWIVDSSGLYIETYPRVLIYPPFIAVIFTCPRREGNTFSHPFMKWKFHIFECAHMHTQKSKHKRLFWWSRFPTSGLFLCLPASSSWVRCKRSQMLHNCRISEQRMRSHLRS